MMQDPLIGLAGVLVGALLGLLGVVIANRSNLTRLQVQIENERECKSSDIKRERLEELYVLLSHWITVFFSNYMHLTLVMRDKMDYNQYLEEVIASGNKNKSDFQRMEMIINIYGNELLPAYEKVLKLREKITDISEAHRSDYMEGVDGSKHLDPYTKAHQQLEMSVKQLQSQVATLAKNA